MSSVRELQLRLRASAVNGHGPRRGEIAKLPLPKSGAALVPVMAGVSDIVRDRGALLQASRAFRGAQGHLSRHARYTRPGLCIHGNPGKVFAASSRYDSKGAGEVPSTMMCKQGLSQERRSTSTDVLSACRLSRDGHALLALL